MSFFSDWWDNTTKQEKFVQFIVFLLVFGYSTDIRGGMAGTPMCVACLYITYDCIKRKSLAGFYMPKKYWLGIVVFLGSVVLASVLLGDKPSIRIAGQYVYWALPFPVLFYLGKQANIKYAVLLGVILSLVVFAINTMYTDYLFIQKYHRVKSRLSAFGRATTTHALVVIGILPVLLLSFWDKKLRANSKVLILQVIVSLLGFWSLWKAGSRGAALGFCLGAVVTGLIVCYRLQIWKTILAFFSICTLLISGYAFFDIIPFGHRTTYDDTIRLRIFSSSYAMWNDHKLLGVGLANWNEQYRKKYQNKKEISKKVQASVRKRYAALKADKKQKVTAKQLQAAIRRATRRTIKRDAKFFNMSHNVPLWFFDTTGVLGGIGYLFFVGHYACLLMTAAEKYPEKWMIAACLWLFLAMHIFGMVDAGITNKTAARLSYLMLGIGLSYIYVAKDDGVESSG